MLLTGSHIVDMGITRKWIMFIVDYYKLLNQLSPSIVPLSAKVLIFVHLYNSANICSQRIQKSYQRCHVSLSHHHLGLPNLLLICS